MSINTLTASWQAARRRRESNSFLAITWRRFVKHRMSLFGLFTLLILIGAAIVAPFITQDPTRLDLSEAVRLKPPSAEHWFGTDHLGRDVLARSLNGARISIAVGFIATAIAIGVGVLVGSLAGYYGGLPDNLLMRLVDLVLSLPIIFVIIVLQTVVARPSIFNVMIVIGATSWMGTARIVRGQILKERETEYILAAHALGSSPGWIILRHLLPNVIGPVIVAASLRVGQAIITEAALSFIGFGVQPPATSWGLMLSEARDYLATGPWIAIFPGLMLSLTVLSFNFVGDGLTSALNPHEYVR